MEKIAAALNSISKGYEVYAVGGFVRDLLLKRKHTDIDLAVNKNALRFAVKTAKLFNSKVVVLDDISKIYRIPLKDAPVENIDISLLDGKNIVEDLKKRDFTVNAFAFNLEKFADFKKNLTAADKKNFAHLKSKTLYSVSSGAFKADPLRMLRAFRFAAETGLTISRSLLAQIKKNAALIQKSAPERIKNEFFRILARKNCSAVVKMMDECGLLAALFSEIGKMKKAAKKYYYHPGGLFQHSFETMSAADNIISNLEKFFPDNFKDLSEHFFQNGIYSQNVGRAGILKFAALFHDSAKPETAKKEGSKMRFFGHEEAGAQKVGAIMKSLKMGKKETAAAVFLIENHMRPSTLTKNNVVTKKAALKFFRDIGDFSADLLILAMADWHSYKRLKVFAPKMLKMQEKSVRELIKLYFEFKNAKPLPKIIDGRIIMKKFKLKPGPWIGELIKIAVEKQSEGSISSQKEALDVISKKL
ncbi:MAG: HD domain-containing protein, partial [Endomicrobium sp.]|nr:HD domain-containing protein [Endomicrobium sp.]